MPSLLNDLSALESVAGFPSTANAPRVLEGARFENVKLDRLLIGPGNPPESIVHVRDCSFSACAVQTECRVAPGVQLERVVFADIASPDLLVINTQTVLDQVVVKGKLKGLWVKPSDFVDDEQKSRFNDWARAAAREVDCMIDFSQLEAEEIEVVGLPLARLRWNREQHVALKLEWKTSDAWKRAGLAPQAFWSSRMRRLEIFGATEGVYTLPSRKLRRHAQAKEELARLIDAGVPLIVPDKEGFGH